MCTELTSARLSGALSSLKLPFLTFRLSLTQLTSPDVALLYLKLSLGASSSHISHSLSSPEGYQIFSSLQFTLPDLISPHLISPDLDSLDSRCECLSVPEVICLYLIIPVL